MRKDITENQIIIEDSISPFIYVDGNRIGMWQAMDKEIIFDYSLKFFGINNERIKCEKEEIKNMIIKRFNENNQ